MARVRHRIGVAGDLNSIYRAMHEPAGLTGWWASTADGRAQVGQTIDLHFEALATLSFKILDLEENSRIGLQCVSGPGPWQDCLLSFAFTRDDQQVWVTLEHESAGVSDDDFIYFSTKWPIYLLSLRDFIETGRGTPYPNEVKIHVGD